MRSSGHPASAIPGLSPHRRPVNNKQQTPGMIKLSAINIDLSSKKLFTPSKENYNSKRPKKTKVSADLEINSDVDSSPSHKHKSSQSHQSTASDHPQIITDTAFDEDGIDDTVLLGASQPSPASQKVASVVPTSNSVFYTGSPMQRGSKNKKNKIRKSLPTSEKETDGDSSAFEVIPQSNLMKFPINTSPVANVTLEDSPWDMPSGLDRPDIDSVLTWQQLAPQSSSFNKLKSKSSRIKLSSTPTSTSSNSIEPSIDSHSKSDTDMNSDTASKENSSSINTKQSETSRTSINRKTQNTGDPSTPRAKMKSKTGKHARSRSVTAQAQFLTPQPSNVIPVTVTRPRAESVNGTSNSQSNRNVVTKDDDVFAPYAVPVYSCSPAASLLPTPSFGTQRTKSSQF